jgi:hypothetical protein
MCMQCATPTVTDVCMLNCCIRKVVYAANMTTTVQPALLLLITGTYPAMRACMQLLLLL